MRAYIVCEERSWFLQGYAYKAFHFRYKCPTCGKTPSGNFCANCGTKIEYPSKPKDFKLYESDAEWHVDAERKES